MSQETWDTIGVVADALSGLGAVGARLVALATWNRQLADARRQQALLIDVDFIANNGPSSMHLEVTVVNRSQQAISQLCFQLAHRHVRLFMPSTERIVVSKWHGRLGPSEVFTVLDELPSSENAPHCRVLFADSFSRFWFRDDEVLKELVFERFAILRNLSVGSVRRLKSTTY